MIAPLTRWTCDNCGQDVSGDDGLLMFQNESAEPFLAYEFRIVHTSTRQRRGDNDEFVDLIRRLHTPYYEQARERFTDPQIARALSRDDRWHPYRPANLRRLAEPAGSAAR